MIFRLLQLFCLFTFSFHIFTSKNALAQTVDSIYYGWAVYEHGKNEGDKKCYIASTPHKSDSSYTANRNPYLAITRYSKTRSEEVSVNAGYEYKLNSDVYLLIGKTQKQLYTKNNIAWARSDYDDKEIIKLMLQSEYFKARSDSSTGNYSIDEYELKGIARAYARMKELCK
ncbi:MAG: hypothetical protein K0R25_700 [Rickettsiaceae bacterium]|jgi:hypothetical protein|nr:hypothetical protein [Rickettsiaceae bacterium]